MQQFQINIIPKAPLVEKLIFSHFGEFQVDGSEFAIKLDNFFDEFPKGSDPMTRFYFTDFTTGGGSGRGGEVPFEIDGHLSQIDTSMIDADFMNSRFEKYLKSIKQTNVDPEQLQQTLDELHKSFATLTQEEQKFANIFIHDTQSGNVIIDPAKSFRDYITEYQSKAKSDEISKISEIFGLDQAKLRALMSTNITEANINEYGRFDDLKSTVDKTKAKAYFENLENNPIPPFKINIKIHNLLQEFVLRGGFEV